MIDVYADLLFLVDFCMDLACISACERISGAGGVRWRRMLAAAIGGIYSVCSLFIPEGAVSVLCALVSWQLICLVAFYRRGDSLLRQLKLSLCYLAVNALLGGCVSAVFGLLGRFSYVLPTDLPYAYADSTLRLIFLSASTACLLLYLVTRGLRSVRLDRPEYVKITEFEGSVTLRAICDTGNLLAEPLTGTPCTVISREDLIALGGGCVLSLLEGKFTLDGIPCGVRVALVPTRTVSGEGIMPAFFSTVELLDREGKTIRKCETAVAVSNSGAPSAGRAVLPWSMCR